MTQIFYQVTGGEPLEFCRDFKQRYIDKQREFAAYSEAKGGIGYTDSWGFFGGVIFNDDAQRPAGFKVERRRTSDGHTFCTPEKRTVAGKALREEFDALGRFPMSDEFAERFGIPQSLSYRKSDSCHGSMLLTSGGFSTAQVVWAGDDFWVILPDIADTISHYAAKGCTCTPASFTPPAGIEASTKARWELALAAHRVRTEEGGAA